MRPSTQRNCGAACALTWRPAAPAWRAASPPALLFYWQGNEAWGPWSGSCRRAGRRHAGKKTTRVKISRPGAGQDPFPMAPQHGTLGVRSCLPAAATLIGSSQHGDGVICRQCQPSSPRPRGKPRPGMAAGPGVWRHCSSSLSFSLHTHSSESSPRGDTVGTGCPGTWERDGRARRLLACPEQAAWQPTTEGRLHLPASRPRVPGAPSPAPWLQEAVGCWPSCVPAASAPLQLLTQVVPIPGSQQSGRSPPPPRLPRQTDGHVGARCSSTRPTYCFGLEEQATWCPVLHPSTWQEPSSAWPEEGRSSREGETDAFVHLFSAMAQGLCSDVVLVRMWPSPLPPPREQASVRKDLATSSPPRKEESPSLPPASHPIFGASGMISDVFSSGA